MSITKKPQVTNNTYNVSNTYTSADNPVAVRTFVPSGVQSLSTVNPGSTISLNAITVAGFNAVINGWALAVPQTTASLPAAPLTGTSDNLVFLECYNGTTTRLRVVDAVDFSTYPEGINHGSQVKAMMSDGTLTSYTYAKSSTDSGLYIAGTGSAGDKTALGTVDGYVYAIPLFRIKRRNSGGYSVANTNGARNYFTTSLGSGIGNIALGQSQQYTASSSDYANYQVGDLFVLTTNSNYSFKIISKDGSNKVTVVNTGSTLGTEIGTSYLKSDHPQGLYSNIIDAKDIQGGDLRHLVSLTGFNYDQYLQSSLNKLISGALTTKYGTMLQKDWFGFKGYMGNANKNMCPTNAEDWEQGSIGSSIGTTYSEASSTTRLRLISDFITAQASKQVTYSVASGYECAMVQFSIDSATLSSASWAQTQTITTLSNCAKVGVYLRKTAGTDILPSEIPMIMPQLELGSTSTTFEPNTKRQVEPLRRTKSDQQTSETVVKTVSPYVSIVFKPSTAKHKMYRDSSATNDNPTSLTSGYEGNAGSYVSLATKDGNTVATTSTTIGNYEEHYFSFDLTELYTSVAGIAPSLKSLKFGWDGRAESDNTGVMDRAVNISIWKGTTWSNNQVAQTDSVNMTPIELSLTSGFADYVDANGKVWFLVRTHYPASATIQSKLFTDTCGLTVEKNAWAVGNKVDITSVDGIISGVIDADTALAKIVQWVDIRNFIVDSTSKLSVGDTFLHYNINGTAGSATKTITAIDVTTNKITISSDFDNNSYSSGWIYIVETTASTSGPTVTATGVAGTWSGLGTKTATYTITTAPTTTTDSLVITYSANYPAGQGLPYVATSVKDVINAECAVAINGRTLINLLGKDGGFETLPSWTLKNGGTVELNSSNVVYGANRIKITIATGQTSEEYYKTVTVESTKYYLVAVSAVCGSVINASILNGNLITGATFSTSYKKYYGVSSIECGCVVNGVAGQYGYFDGARLYELTDSLAQTFGYSTGALLYSAIGTTITDSEVIGRMFPYVDSVQFKSNILGTTKGKNLIPAFDSGEFSLHANAAASGYTLTLNATAANQISKITLNVKSNTQYKISFSALISNQYVNLWESPTTSNWVFKNGLTSGSTGITFTTSSDTNYIYLEFQSTASGTFTFTNPMLTLASADQTFELQVKSQFHTPLKLADSEVVYAMPGGQSVFVQKWAKDVQLTGDLAWVVLGNYTGFKRVCVMASTIDSNMLLYSKPIVTKYNGIPLTYNTTTTSSADLTNIDVNSLLISASNTDTGFIDSISATVLEWKAYFYGWKMCASDGTAYVSGTKYWKKITDGTGITSTLPTASYTGWTNYTLCYKLATAIPHVGCVNGDQTKPILSSGSVVYIPQGIAQVEQLSGVQWMEVPTIIYSSGISTWIINSSSYPLSKRVKQSGVNKVSSNFTFISDTSSKTIRGDGYFGASPVNYDPTAQYQVTYEMLDKYAYTVDSFAISNPTVSYAYSYQDTTNPDHSIGYFSFKDSLFTFVNECKQIQISAGDLNGFACYYEYTPYQGNTATSSTVLALSDKLFVTTGGTGKLSTNATMKSITPFLPKSTGVYDYQLLQDDVALGYGYNYSFKSVNNYTDDGSLGVNGSTQYLPSAVGDKITTAVPHLSFTYGLIRTSNGEVMLRLQGRYSNDVNTYGFTNAIADYQIPGRPLIK